MAKSKIEITFVSVPNVDDVLEINNNLSAIPLLETFKSLRTANYLTTIGGGTDDSAFLYIDALELDYNSTSLYTITRSLNVVTIEATQSNVVFSVLQNTSSGRITTSITNETETAPLEITSITFSEADTLPCQNVKVNVTTNVLATSVTSPVTITPNVDNPFSFDYLRGQTITISCTDGVNVTTQSVTLPLPLKTSNITTSVTNTPTGGSVYIRVPNVFLATDPYISDSFMDLEYSLDNVTWQTSATFSGLANGTYTAYIRDQFGCSVSIGFAVSVFSPSVSLTSPYSYLAKEMSIRFKRNQVWDNKLIHKNEDNTLSCEEKVEIAYPYYHLFQTDDTITTQFLSNYENISANVIRENGVKNALTVVKKTSNIGATDKRDAIYFNAENDKTAIYFTSGNTYNYTTGVVNGTYELNGELPEYATINNYIYLDGLGWFTIEDIVYNDDVNADTIIIDYTYTGIPANIIVSSLYNRENFEVYEFSIDMGDYENEEIQVEILQSDDTFGEYNYLSEKIRVLDVFNDTIEFIWYNTTDTRVYYSTGIKHKARLLFETFTAGNDSTLEIHKTDTTTILIDSESYETNELSLDGLSSISTGIKRQLTKAFMCKELYLDGIKYVPLSAPETEPIPYTNQYKLKANLIKTSNVFTSELSGEETTISNIEILGLLQDDNNYIKV